MLRSEAQTSRQQPQPRPSSAIATLSSPSIFMGGPPAHSPVMDPHGGVSARDRDRENRDREVQRARFLDQGSNKRIKLDQPGASLRGVFESV